MADENAYEVQLTEVLNELARSPRDVNVRNKARESLLVLLNQAYEEGQRVGQHFGFLEGVRSATKDAYLAGLRDAQSLEDEEEDEVPVKRKGGRPKKE